ncbi:hypothetical protein [Paenibacillus sp. Marseille-Q4541]|uniref:hypothetical protein n=1 Tax=Paenibacillus sp. Marseille-Q4541 TaxID=2831522 RepID=UPI001BA7CE24|nr:hypothetical protein [Paenibacillus sp. Marseille-Q4541]
MYHQGHHMKKHCCPTLKPIVCDPVHVVKNHYHKAVQPIIHPVEIVNKHHVIPVPCHEWAVVEREEEGQMGHMGHMGHMGCGPDRNNRR